jgi:hypothetical protein
MSSVPAAKTSPVASTATASAPESNESPVPAEVAVHRTDPVEPSTFVTASSLMSPCRIRSPAAMASPFPSITTARAWSSRPAPPSISVRQRVEPDGCAAPRVRIESATTTIRVLIGAPV